MFICDTFPREVVIDHEQLVINHKASSYLKGLT